MVAAALSTNLILRKRKGKRGQGRLIRMGAALMMGYWARLQSSSRSIKVFANYHFKKKPNNKKVSQKGEFISRNIIDNKDNQKMKMMMLNRCSNRSNAKGDNISNTINNTLDNDFVVYEILSRLPVKTLMRFKSVSKRWRSSIQHDPHFHRVHFGHSETCRPLHLLAIPFPYETVIGQYQVLEATDDLIREALSYHTFKGWDSLLIVKGLACLVSQYRDAVRIYNPSTRQETQWIKTTTRSDGHRIVFGFDPVTNKHKVLRHHPKSATPHEVLIVGDNSWRRIDRDHQVPNYNLRGPCVYLNGAIYWMGKISLKHDHKIKWGSGAPEVLVVFDVGTEKFRVIPIPDFIINQPRDESYRGGCYTHDLLEVNGHVALLSRKNKNTVSMWMIYDDDGHHHQNWIWTEVVMKLPFDWVGKDGTVHFTNVPWTDQIIVSSCINGLGFTYSYNWKNGTFKTLGGPYFAQCTKESTSSTDFTEKACFVESLFPVISNKQPQ